AKEFEPNCGQRIVCTEAGKRLEAVKPTHPHTWDFADTPHVNGVFLGPRRVAALAPKFPGPCPYPTGSGVGAQVSWTLPLPWYSQLIFASQNGRGETGFSFRNPGDNGVFSIA